MYRLVRNNRRRPAPRRCVAVLALALLALAPLSRVAAQPGEPGDDRRPTEPAGDSEAAAGEQAAGGEAIETSTEDDPPTCVDFVKPEDRQEPKRLTLLGVRCFRAGDYARAYTLYSRAYDISRSALLQAALGRSLHELGVFHAARGYYQTFLEAEDTSSAGATKIRGRLDQLDEDAAANGTALDVTSYPAGATVHLELPNGDWMEAGRTPARMTLRAGDWKLKFTHPDHRTATRDITLSADNAAAGSDPEDTANAANATRKIQVELVSLRSEFDISARKWKRAGLITGLSSIPVLAGAGVFFGLTADNFAEADDYIQDLQVASKPEDYEPAAAALDRGHRNQRIAIGLAGAGGAALITGAILWIRGKAMEDGGNTAETTADTEKDGKATVRPLLGPARAGVRVRW